MEDGAFGVGERADLSAGQLRGHRGADRDREGDGAVRRRLHHAHALGGRPAARGDGRGDSHRPGGWRAGRDLPSQGGGRQRNWAKAAQVVAKIDSARAAGQDVRANMYPYTARRNRARRVPPAVGVGGRKAARESRGSRDAREDPRGDRARRRAYVGESVRARDAGRACCCTAFATAAQRRSTTG